jgi:hypothetical protein
MAALNPVYYNAPIGIRFEIGGDEGVYLENEEKSTANPAYVSAALNRAQEIYKSLPHRPNILRIDGYPDEETGVENIISTVCKATGLPQPHEQLLIPFQWDEEDEVITKLQLYWDLHILVFSPEKLLQEIIKADIGGHSVLASSVYFINTIDLVLFHLYDDRGADLVAADKELLRAICDRFNKWILDYNREEINMTFSRPND